MAHDYIFFPTLKSSVDVGFTGKPKIFKLLATDNGVVFGLITLSLEISAVLHIRNTHS